MTRANTLTPILILTLLLLTPAVAKASLFDDFINEMNNKLQGGADRVKSLVTPVANTNVKDKVLSVESAIALAPEGDVNKNGEIDSGDIVRFSFVLTNTTDKVYSYATLKTNINRKQLNFIHSLRGATGLTDNKDTIEFRNIRIGPNEQRVISFDARVNYSKEDKIISSEPEFVSSDGNPVGKFQKKEISAKKLSKEEINKRLENRRQKLKKILRDK